MTQSKPPKDQNKDTNPVWEQVTKTIKPLKPSKKRAPQIVPSRRPMTIRTPQPSGPPVRKQIRGSSELLYTSPRRLKRPLVEARIDLHGMKQYEAREALFHFIGKSFQKGLKTVLVVTGKGLKSLLTEGSPGAIKQNFPTWLQDPQVHSLIHFYAPAHPQDGGSGAYYVVLKKRKFNLPE